MFTSNALINLLDVNGHWFKSHHGLNGIDTPKDYSFCTHPINWSDHILLVEDASENIRFYAGVVLKNNQNLPFGTVCVIHQKQQSVSKD